MPKLIYPLYNQIERERNLWTLTRPIDQETIDLIEAMPGAKNIIEFTATIKMLQDHHYPVGMGLFLCGEASLNDHGGYKSTLLQILACKHVNSITWTGDAWLRNDTLKWDDVYNANVETLITEELQLLDVLKKKQPEHALIEMKSVLTGQPMNVRLAKNTSVSKEGSLTIKRIYCSFNPRQNVTAESLGNLVSKYEDYAKRFLVINMDKIPAKYNMYIENYKEVS